MYWRAWFLWRKPAEFLCLDWSGCVRSRCWKAKSMPRKILKIPPPQNSGLLAPAEAAANLGISVGLLHQLRRRGEIPSVPLAPRRWRFSPKALQAYAAAKQQPAKSSAASAAFPPTNFSDPDVVIRLANAILATCIDQRASDIHIDLNRRNVVIRCRIDGRLQQMMTTPPHVYHPLLERYKLMAGARPARQAVPRMGSVPIKHNDNDYNLRCSFLPGAYSESIVIHILDQAMIYKDPMDLGMGEILWEVDRLFGTRGGLLLFAGGTGSGVTTTAFSFLHRWNASERSLHTLEEITEYQVHGIMQASLFANRRLSRRSWLRAALRHDPDILFLGDIRDPESASVAVEASLSGKLTLATLPAADAMGALYRLIDFGVSAEQIAQCAIWALAQRLLRRTCTECRTSYSVPETGLVDFDHAGAMRYGQEMVTLYRGVGCSTCEMRGDKGQIGTYELLSVNTEIADLLRHGASRRDLYGAAARGGMKSLHNDILRKTLNGIISLAEARRVSVALRERVV